MEELEANGLIGRCLEGDASAWHALHERYGQALRVIIWYRLGEERYDRHLIEDIAQMVWLSLLTQDYQGLRRYEAERASFNTYLREAARQMIELHRRANGRRLQTVPLERHDAADGRVLSPLLLAQFAEYKESLTPQESRVVPEMAEDSPENGEAPMSAGNRRVLIYRTRRKWGNHFDTIAPSPGY